MMEGIEEAPEMPPAPQVLEKPVEEVSPPVDVPAEAGVAVEGEQQQEQQQQQQQGEQPEEAQQPQQAQGEEMEGQQAAAAKPDDPKIEEAKKYLEEVRFNGWIFLRNPPPVVVVTPPPLHTNTYPHAPTPHCPRPHPPCHAGAQSI